MDHATKFNHPSEMPFVALEFSYLKMAMSILCSELLELLCCHISPIFYEYDMVAHC